MRCGALVSTLLHVLLSHFPPTDRLLQRPFSQRWSPRMPGPSTDLRPRRFGSTLGGHHRSLHQSIVRRNHTVHRAQHCQILPGLRLPSPVFRPWCRRRTTKSRETDGWYQPRQTPRVLPASFRMHSRSKGNSASRSQPSLNV